MTKYIHNVWYTIITKYNKFNNISNIDYDYGVHPSYKLRDIKTGKFDTVSFKSVQAMIMMVMLMTLIVFTLPTVMSCKHPGPKSR